MNGNYDQGAVYVFTKPASGWADETQAAKLTASDGAVTGWLGYSVAVVGTTIAAGALACHRDPEPRPGRGVCVHQAHPRVGG